MNLRVLLLNALFASLFVSHLCAQAVVLDQKSPTNTNLIHFGDLIDVDVVGSFEYDWRGTLTPEGFLEAFNKIPNQIYGLCRSESELAETIEKEYRTSLRDPKIVVKILDRSNRAVAYLDGAVRFPQRFQIRRRVFLNELLIMSGGITDKSSGEVHIFRPQNLNCEAQKPVITGSSSDNVKDKASQNTVIRISDLLAGTDSSNPQVSSGDIVTVVEAAPVFLIGGVNLPKQISLRVETTLSRAIAMAGGVAKEGLEDKIRIFRRDGMDRLVIDANLRQILTKAAEDPILKAFDVIDVEQKGRGPRKLPPVVESGSAGNERLSRLPLRIVD